jgi:MerR family transcriptional regulator, mercuric resistance operon regulatory protein
MGNAEYSKGYAIGELSRLTGVNIETIRYYERIGIMPKPDRTAGGYRQFGYQHLKRLSFVRKSRNLGFSLKEVRALLSMVDEDHFSCGEIHAITLEHLTEIDTKMDALRKLKSVLSKMANECSQGDVPECPVIDALFEMD